MNLQRLLIKLIFTAFAMTFILACQQDDMGRQVADKDIDRHDTIAQVDNRSQLNELQ